MDSMSASSSAGHPNISTSQFPNTTSLPADSHLANNYLAAKAAYHAVQYKADIRLRKKTPHVGGAS